MARNVRDSVLGAALGVVGVVEETRRLDAGADLRELHVSPLGLEKIRATRTRVRSEAKKKAERASRQSKEAAGREIRGIRCCQP